MRIEIINEAVKKVTAENGKVLSNGGEFAQYPIEIYTAIEDNSWTEIDEPIKIIANEITK